MTALVQCRAKFTFSFRKVHEVGLVATPVQKLGFGQFSVYEIKPYAS